MRRMSFLTVLALLVSLAAGHDACAADRKSEVRRIILESRHWSAYDSLLPQLAYTQDSVKDMAQKLTKDDIPFLFALHRENPKEMDVGTALALESLCGYGLEAIGAAYKTSYRDSAWLFDTVLSLSEPGAGGCGPKVGADAMALRADIEIMRKKQVEESRQRAEQERGEQNRLNQNAIGLIAGNKPLTRAEREEQFNRTIAAMGLAGSRTPEQEQMYQKMHKSMLGE
jgi:hypothetical protein